MMANRQRRNKVGIVTDTVEISILLIGNDAEQRHAISLIDRRLRRAIWYKIRETAISLPADEVMDVYNEVLLAVWVAAKERRYDPDKPLLPFLLTLAHRKACDRLRHDMRGKHRQVELLDEVLNSLKDTKVGEAWQRVAAQEHGSRMMDIIRRTVVKMPERQRQVASVRIGRFPTVPSAQEVCEEIYERTGERITVVAAKRAWQEARNKIRERLVESGYMGDDTHGR